MKFEDLKLNHPFETDQTEFKEKLNKNDYFDWLKTICAFANTKGGTLYVGVNDKTRELNGMTIDEVEREVNRLQSNDLAHLSPTVRLSFSYIDYLDGERKKWILKVDVPESYSKPVFMEYRGMATPFFRREGVSSPSTIDEIRAMLVSYNSTSYDAFVSDISYKKEDFGILNRTYSSENDGQTLSIAKLQSIGFMDDQLHLTRGALLFKDDCQDPITKIHLRYWGGFSKGGDTLIDNKIMKGNLLTLREEILSFIARHSSTGFQKKGTSGQAMESYPILALREAVTNALAHRNYFMMDTEIGLDIFPDRLTIFSPGSAYGGKTIKDSRDLLSIFPWRRNQIICDVFSLCHMMDQSRSGFEKICESYSRQPENRRPLINCDENCFQITLFDCMYQSPFSVNDPTAKTILNFCKEPHSLSEIAAHLKMNPSSYFRKKYVTPLLIEGRLATLGKRNSPSLKYITTTE